MLTWCMAHPWMTLLIVVLAIITIDNIIANVCGAVSEKAKYKAKNKTEDEK